MKNRLILASSSPRRIELLKKALIDFDSVEHRFDENSINIRNPVRLAEILAWNKAQSIACHKDYHNEYVLGVDTVVAYKNHILGKPSGKDEADDFIRLLSGRTHRVISGIALLHQMKAINLIRHDVTFVTFRKFDEEFIKYYLDNNHWIGYAGGYAIQSIFSLMVRKIQGSYSNIVGLPVSILYEMLKDANFNFVWEPVKISSNE